eukprot:Gb_08691 [translate_table: standard]
MGTGSNGFELPGLFTSLKAFGRSIASQLRSCRPSRIRMVLENNNGNFGLATENHMLGYACFRPPLRSRASISSVVALTHSPCSHYSAQNSHRHSSSLVLFPRSIFHREGHSSIEGCCQLSNAKRSQHHSSSCLLAGNGAMGATIWHALLPSCHFSDRGCGLDPPKTSSVTLLSQRLPSNGGLVSSSDSLFNNNGISACGSTQRKLNLLQNISANRERSSVGLCGKYDVNCSKFPAVAGLSEGSWNATWDVRPARWLHGSHSAWLLFGVCACFSSLNPANTEAELDQNNDGVDDGFLADKVSHGKKVYTDYSVTGIPGDGRCLFRAVAHLASLRSGKPAPNESLQRELADELRTRSCSQQQLLGNKQQLPFTVTDELLKRREETEWFIEGDFDVYVEQIKQSYVWGGEPELLMASHVLQMPITVYMRDRNSDGLIAIAEYGQEYGKENPIRMTPFILNALLLSSRNFSHVASHQAYDWDSSEKPLILCYDNRGTMAAATSYGEGAQGSYRCNRKARRPAKGVQGCEEVVGLTEEQRRGRAGLVATMGSKGRDGEPRQGTTGYERHCGARTTWHGHGEGERTRESSMQ